MVKFLLMGPPCLRGAYNIFRTRVLYIFKIYNVEFASEWSIMRNGIVNGMVYSRVDYICYYHERDGAEGENLGFLNK